MKSNKKEKVVYYTGLGYWQGKGVVTHDYKKEYIEQKYNHSEASFFKLPSDYYEELEINGECTVYFLYPLHFYHSRAAIALDGAFVYVLQYPKKITKDMLQDDEKLKIEGQYQVEETDSPATKAKKIRDKVVIDAASEVTKQEPENCINKSDKLVANKLAKILFNNQEKYFDDGKAPVSERTMQIVISDWIQKD